MSLNQHQVVTFNDGEPLDPVKLNKLSQNINTLYERTALTNQTTQSGNIAVPIIFTAFLKFSKVGPGKAKEQPINMSTVFSDSELKSGRVFAVAGCRSQLDDGDDVSVSITDITTSPKVCVVNSGKESKTISVDVIAVLLKEVSASG